MTETLTDQQQEQRELLTRYYKEIFEDDKRGAIVLADLERRFNTLPKPNPDGIGRVLDQFECAGKRAVLEYIIKQINLANRVPYDE